MTGLTHEAIARLSAGRALDAHVAVLVMGMSDSPLEPLIAPRYSTDDALASQVLARLQSVVPAPRVLDERPTTAGHRVDYTDEPGGTILIETTALSRPVAICRFALFFQHQYPELLDV